MKVKSESEVDQSCPTLSDPMDCSLSGFSFRGIFQARVLEWVSIAFSDLKVGANQKCTDEYWQRYKTAAVVVWETNSLKRTMQVVECSLLHTAYYPRQSLLLAKDPDQFLRKHYTF